MITKYEFIQINCTIQDYSQYVKQTMLIKNYLKNKFLDLVYEGEFNLELDLNKSYDKTELVLYNKENDLEIKIEIKKRNEEVFV